MNVVPTEITSTFGIYAELYLNGAALTTDTHLLDGETIFLNKGSVDVAQDLTFNNGNFNL